MSEMDDKTLLERAARAAGIEIAGPHRDGYGLVTDKGALWNPIRNAADCFRLMVALRLCVSYSDLEDGYEYVGVHNDKGIHIHREPGVGGQTTRRAIVRAAAALDRST